MRICQLVRIIEAFDKYMLPTSNWCLYVCQCIIVHAGVCQKGANLHGTEHVDLVWTQHVWSCSVLQIRYKLEQSSFSTNWSIVQLSTKMHFRKLDQTFQLSTKILLNFSFLKKKIKKLGSVRPKILYEIDRTLCGEHSQVNS